MRSILIPIFDWTQRKYEQLLLVNSGKDYKKLDTGNIPVYGTGGYMLSVNKSLSDKDAIGLGRKGTIDKPQLLKAPFWTVDTLFFMTPISGNNLYFLYSQSQNINWKKYDESTGLPSLSKATINKIMVRVPEIEEQAKIGTLFLFINKTIKIQQRKLDLLKQLKKGFLQEMFADNKKKIPSLRFKGFTSSWTQRKLGEVVIVKDGTHASPTYISKGYPLVTSKNLKNGKIDFSDISFISKHDYDVINKRSKVNKGDILFGMIGTIGNLAIVEAEGFAIKNVALLKSQKFTNQYFIYNLLSSNIFKEYINRFYSGNTQKFLALNQIKKFQFCIPKRTEADKVANILLKINKIISIQQEKINKLQNIKQFLLQNMFI